MGATGAKGGGAKGGGEGRGAPRGGARRGWCKAGLVQGGAGARRGWCPRRQNARRLLTPAGEQRPVRAGRLSPARPKSAARVCGRGAHLRALRDGVHAPLDLTRVLVAPDDQVHAVGQERLLDVTLHGHARPAHLPVLMNGHQIEPGVSFRCGGSSHLRRAWEALAWCALPRGGLGRGRGRGKVWGPRKGVGADGSARVRSRAKGWGCEPRFGLGLGAEVGVRRSARSLPCGRSCAPAARPARAPARTALASSSPS